MPLLARVFLRTALIYLALGFSIGGLLQINKVLGMGPRIWGLLPVHIELLFLGWTLQLALGVSYWIMPRIEMERPRAWLAALGYGFVNGGLALFALGHLATVLNAGPGPQWLTPLAGVFIVGGVISFAAHIWPRVRPILLSG